MIGDGEDAAGKVVLLRPKMQERLLRGAADLPRERREHGAATAILAKLDGGGRAEVAEGSSSSAASSMASDGDVPHYY